VGDRFKTNIFQKCDINITDVRNAEKMHFALITTSESDLSQINKKLTDARSLD
jgi:hypothetical protein